MMLWNQGAASVSVSRLPSRRDCLAGLLVALASLSGVAIFRSWDGKGAIAPGPALLALFDDAPRARAIGLAFLRTLPPAERSAEHLIAAVSCGASPKLEAQAPQNVARLINERIRRDFSEGTVVAVDGWFLSLTEARLYALAALA
jgi:hypothetical protein